mmetsp:Transcript_109367/g.223467  ORF Transcript_109367/g.223467 Transcript_109367/m.223467 type:complete len:141 (-) Transcript_109367:375-797(-)
MISKGTQMERLCGRNESLPETKTMAMPARSTQGEHPHNRRRRSDRKQPESQALPSLRPCPRWFLGYNPGGGNPAVYMAGIISGNGFLGPMKEIKLRKAMNKNMSNQNLGSEASSGNRSADPSGSIESRIGLGITVLENMS